MDEATVGFFSTLSQVGITAFALMFAAAQFRSEEWIRSELGLITMAGSLFELLTLTMVSLTLSARLLWLWPYVAIALSLWGLWFSVRHWRASGHGRELSRTEKWQKRLNWLPLLSYGSLAAATVLYLCNVDEHLVWTIVSIVLIWLVFSGCSETFLTLSPQFFDPIKDDEQEVDFDLRPATATEDENAGFTSPSITEGKVTFPIIEMIHTKKSGQRGAMELPYVQIVPARGVPRASVLLFHEVWGVNHSMRRIADRLAGMGAQVGIVDLTPNRGGFLGAAYAFHRFLTRGDGLVLARTRESVRNWRRSEPNLPLIGVGFSLGATALLRAADCEWDGLVCFYPSIPAGGWAPDSFPPTDVVFGGADPALGGTPEELLSVARTAGGAVRISVVEQAGHSFMNPVEAGPVPLRRMLRRRGIASDPSAAEHGWGVIERMLSRVESA